MENILITGVTSGIGKYLNSKLIKKYSIIGIGRSDEKDLDITKYLQGDLREESFLEHISKNIENIDYLILNAGVGYFGNFCDISGENHKEIIETNLISNILLSHILLSKKQIKKGIIFIGSIAGKKSLKHGASYAASKFGLRGFAMQMKNEYPNIKIHLINPKIVDTPFHKNDFVTKNSTYTHTNIEDILKTIENIINKKEKKFEIDL